MKKKAIYLSSLTLITFIALGLFFGLDLNSASASQDVSVVGNQKVRAEMLAVALDFRSAHNPIVVANGIVKNGSSTILGSEVATASDRGSNVQKDLTNAFSAIRQLPFGALENGMVAGRYTSGVYYTNQGNLNSELVLDAEGDENAIFIFRTSGSFNVANGAAISLVNGAQAHNVFFVSDVNATVAAGVNFSGSILARGAITLGEGANVNGKLASVEGDVELNSSTVGFAGVDGVDGSLQVCKAPATTATGALSPYYGFSVAGTTVIAPTGSCAPPIGGLTPGPVTVVELGGASSPTATTFTSTGFVVTSIRVERATGVVTSGVTRNLGTRTVTVPVLAGGQANLTIVTFFNQAAGTGTIEICKEGLDLDASAGNAPAGTMFEFNVTPVIAGGPGSVGPFFIPFGLCSGEISIIVPTGGAPGAGQVDIIETGMSGFVLEDTEIFPATRFVSESFGVFPNGDPNPGGGFVRANVIAGSGNQTIAFFRNRSVGGVVKVCKIAGPGIANGEIFSFSATGLVSVPTAMNPGGVPPVGTAPTAFTLNVQAGPFTNGPAAGPNGFCDLVRDTAGVPVRFVVGSPITVTETGIVTPPPAFADTAVSRIRVFPAGSSPSANLAGRTVTYTVRRGESVAEFVNILVTPGTVKLCKVAGNAATVGQPFSFVVTLENPNGLIPNNFQQNVTLTAGPVGANGSGAGYCTILTGPLASALSPFNTFNTNQRLIIQETNVAAGTTTTVSSPTGATISFVSTTRTATVTISNNTGQTFVNEVIFTNTAPAGPTPTPTPPGTRGASFDFDGDNKADLSTFRPTDGTWNVLRSNSGAVSTQFGANGDQLAPADYDGDGKADYAVFRNGSWYILGSTAGFTAVGFGQAGDIPQPGYYDADNKADIAVFRPSNGGWYMLGSTAGFSSVAFGTNGDRPVAADYDGDGITDPAVYRNGSWYLLRSTAGFIGVAFGIAADRAVPADFNGDGKADLAVYRDGTWYMLRSTPAGFTDFGVQNWGLATDRPAAADYTGDGKADIAVFRSGMWYVLESEGANFRQISHGNPTDLPVPGAYVQ